jgi:hypothetical protein
VCFVIATLWQAGIILTANYTFLNYLVLALGFLLLDDRLPLLPFLPRQWKSPCRCSGRIEGTGGLHGCLILEIIYSRL